MKTKIALVLVAAAVVVLLAVGGLVFLQLNERILMRSPMVAQDPSIITYMEGDVSLASGNSPDADWIPAEIGTRLREGDRLRTGVESLVDVRIHDGGVIRLLDNTEISLDRLTLHHQDLNIAKGTLLAKFKLLFDGQDLRFRTADTIAAVRGTELVFAVDSSGTRIHALSGITEVISPDHPGERILLGTQKSVNIKPGSPPSDPADMTGRQAGLFRLVFNSINHEEVFLISHNIRFEANTANILDESKENLDAVAKKLLLRRDKILIAGHTADVGGTAGQITLSEERAEAIKRELVARGIPEKRLSTIGYGGSRPVGDNDTPEGRAANRRVEFLVIE